MDASSIISTYNEAENVAVLVEKIVKLSEESKINL